MKNGIEKFLSELLNHWLVPLLQNTKDIPVNSHASSGQLNSSSSGVTVLNRVYEALPSPNLMVLVCLSGHSTHSPFFTIPQCRKNEEVCPFSLICTITSSVKGASNSSYSSSSGFSSSETVCSVSSFFSGFGIPSSAIGAFLPLKSTRLFWAITSTLISEVSWMSSKNKFPSCGVRNSKSSCAAKEDASTINVE